jgi:Oxidoreductase family, NAD-binding Rossmann fold
MAKEIRVGLIGAGFIGQMHSLSLGDIRRVRREPVICPSLMAVCERNPTLAGMMVDRYGWQEIVSDWHAIITRSDVDLLINAGPNLLHAEPSIAAAQSGKHVFCEKPLARSGDEAFSIFKEVESTRVKHMCAFMYRFVPALGVAQTKKVLSLVDNLKRRNLAVVCISHNLHDVLEVSDRCVVLKNGQKVAELTTKDSSFQRRRREMVFDGCGTSDSRILAPVFCVPFHPILKRLIAGSGALKFHHTTFRNYGNRFRECCQKGLRSNTSDIQVAQVRSTKSAIVVFRHVRLCFSPIPRRLDQ